MGGQSLLTFAALDGLAFAAERGKLSGAATLALSVGDIAPLFELLQLAAGGLLPFPEDASWLTLNGEAKLYAALTSPRLRWWVCPTTHRCGFFRTAAAPPVDEKSWIEFGLAAQKAAVSGGFPRETAWQLIGALGEMHSNIYEHSQAANTGVIAFKVAPGMFEFVVTDQGVGVLDTLRSNPGYAGLVDYGEALRLTLTDGVSRHGSQSSRGKGFRPLFLGLANLRGSLRFRSGDHALTIDAASPDLMMARVGKKPVIRGFFAAITCRNE